MRIYTETLCNFEPWQGAIEPYQRIEDAGKVGELEDLLVELFPDGLSETDLNDLLWFEPRHITLPLCVASLDEIEDEIANGDGLDAFLSTWLDQVSHINRDELLELCMQYAVEDRREEIAEIIGA